MEVFDQFFARATSSNIGSRLWTLLTEAGFEHPDCRAEYVLLGASDSTYHEWVTESFRSIHPRAVALGVITEGEFDLDSLESRLREEGSAGNGSVPAPAMVGAFARLRG